MNNKLFVDRLYEYNTIVYLNSLDSFIKYIKDTRRFHLFKKYQHILIEDLFNKVIKNYY